MLFSVIVNTIFYLDHSVWHGAYDVWLDCIAPTLACLGLACYDHVYRQTITMLTLSPLPTILTYSDDIPEGVGGYAKLNYVMIRPKYQNTDVGIHRHEYRHVIQFYAALFAWFVLNLYLLCISTE